MTTPDANSRLSEPGKQSRGEHTRQLLIDAAFEEIYQNGYRAASLSDILAAAGATKGALYHHFPDKHALGLSAISENVDRHIKEQWLDPLAVSTDPITTISEIFQGYASRAFGTGAPAGCPLNNLSQEMSSIDEAFRVYLEGIYERWRTGLCNALRRGQETGTVDAHIDPAATAALIVALHQGIAGSLKATRDPAVARTCLAGVSAYLNHLRNPITNNRTV